jgi:hypothetical protein
LDVRSNFLEGWRFALAIEKGFDALSYIALGFGFIGLGTQWGLPPYVAAISHNNGIGGFA